MPLLSFQTFPDDARLWLFALPRPLSEAEQATLTKGIEAFQPHWKVHGTPIDSAWALLDEQILAVVERTMASSPSGCAIDAMLRHAQKLARSLDLELLDAQQVLYRAGGRIRIAPKTDLPALIASGELHHDSLILDLGLMELGQLRTGHLDRPLHRTWIWRKHHQLFEEAPTAH